MDEQEHAEVASGRMITVVAYGANAEALELDALDLAREFFGADMRLEVVSDYSVVLAEGESPKGKFRAAVRVREIS